MYEIHGWVNVRESTGEIDDDGALAEVVASIRVELEAKRLGVAFDVQIVETNGLVTLVIEGMPNHRDERVDWLWGLVQRAARDAPGSFGVLYVWDDEDPERSNEFQVTVVRRGELTVERDAFFSPCVPTIEDAG